MIRLGVFYILPFTNTSFVCMTALPAMLRKVMTLPSALLAAAPSWLSALFAGPMTKRRILDSYHSQMMVGRRFLRGFVGNVTISKIIKKTPTRKVCHALAPCAQVNKLGLHADHLCELQKHRIKELDQRPGWIRRRRHDRTRVLPKSEIRPNLELMPL